LVAITKQKARKTATSGSKRRLKANTVPTIYSRGAKNTRRSAREAPLWNVNTAVAPAAAAAGHERGHRGT